MSVIVLADEHDDLVQIASTLAEVMRQHPHRAVLVQANPGAPLEYRVTAQCWLPFGHQQQICCEQIEISGTEAALSELGPVLLAITAPDLPVVAWCRSARMAVADDVRGILPPSAKIIVDSATFNRPAEAFSFLSRGRAVADLSWGRLTHWREIVAQVFADESRSEVLRGIEEVTVLHAEPETPATAYYFAGWVMACAGAAKARFERVPPVGGGIEGLVLRGQGHTVSIRRVEGTAVLIEVDSLKSCAASPRLTDAELLDGELSIPRRDAVFEKTLPLAARLAAGAGT